MLAADFPLFVPLVVMVGLVLVFVGVPAIVLVRLYPADREDR